MPVVLGRYVQRFRIYEHFAKIESTLEKRKLPLDFRKVSRADGLELDSLSDAFSREESNAGGFRSISAAV